MGRSLARNAYDGRMAWISDTLTGGFARGAAATIVSVKAQHSALPVASRSRNDRTRDIDQSIDATIGAGQPSINLFARGKSDVRALR